MSRRRHNKRRRPDARPQQTQAQLAGTLACDGVPAAQAHRVELEQVALGDDKRVIVTRQVVSTPLRSLFQGRHITQAQAHMAERLRNDHNSAFWETRNPLSAVQVDGKGDSESGGIHAAMLYKVSHAIRFHEVERALGEDVMEILRRLVIDETFSSIGKDLAPISPERTQRDMAKGAAVLALRILERFHERGKRRTSSLTPAAARL